jgi:hypothetical protein
MGGVQHLPLHEQQAREALVSTSPEQQLDRCRGVQYDQRLALTARTAPSELSPVNTAER